MNIPHSQTQQPPTLIPNENTFLPIYIIFAGLFEEKFSSTADNFLTYKFRMSNYSIFICNFVLVFVSY